MTPLWSSTFQCGTLLFWDLAAYYPPDTCLITLIFVFTNRFPRGTLLKLYNDSESSATFSVRLLEKNN